MMHVKVKASCDYKMITPALLQAAVSLLQHQCSEPCVKIVEELEKRFQTSKVMDVLGIVYPQYWVVATTDDTFSQHMAILKAFYGVAKKLDQRNVVSIVIDSQLIDVQSSFFKMSMKSMCMWASNGELWGS